MMVTLQTSASCTYSLSLVHGFNACVEHTLILFYFVKEMGNSSTNSPRGVGGLGFGIELVERWSTSNLPENV